MGLCAETINHSFAISSCMYLSVKMTVSGNLPTKPFVFPRVCPIQLGGSIVNTDHKNKLGNKVPKTVQGKVARQETRTRWRRVEMHFPRPEARIYSRKTRTNNQSKTAENGAGAQTQTRHNITKATCAVRNPSSPPLQQKNHMHWNFANVQNVVSTLKSENKSKGNKFRVCQLVRFTQLFN